MALGLVLTHVGWPAITSAWLQWGGASGVLHLSIPAPERIFFLAFFKAWEGREGEKMEWNCITLDDGAAVSLHGYQHTGYVGMTGCRILWEGRYLQSDHNAKGSYGTSSPVLVPLPTCVFLRAATAPLQTLWHNVTLLHFRFCHSFYRIRSWNSCSEAWKSQLHLLKWPATMLHPIWGGTHLRSVKITSSSPLQHCAVKQLNYLNCQSVPYLEQGGPALLLHLRVASALFYPIRNRGRHFRSRN